jgi:acyl carrier protein
MQAGALQARAVAKETMRGLPSQRIVDMDRKRVSQEVSAKVCRTLGTSPADLTDSAQIMNDLGATSVDVVDLLSWMEEHYEIEISDKQATALQTFGQVVDFVCEQKAAH